MNFNIKKCLEALIEKKGSDLHLKVGAPPVVRKNKRLATLFTNHPVLTNKNLLDAAREMLDPVQYEELMENKQIDFGYGIAGLGRFRFSIFFQRGTIRMVARNVPFDLPDFEDLNLPNTLTKIFDTYQDGLILVTGATGSGKSTSVVSLLNYINKTRSRHIITVEEPIEFLIQDKKSIISQREMGSDYVNDEQALKSSLRQDPDIIFFGELRNRTSAETILTAANTGHLVITTLHTNNAAETITRVLSLFNSDTIGFTRMNFASCLRAIISQKLVPAKDGKSLVPAVEILINNPRVRGILEDEKQSTSVITQVIEESREGWGMQSLNQHLLDLVRQDAITKEAAIEASYSPEKLRLAFSGLNHSKNNSTGQFATDIEAEELSIVKTSFKKSS